jgi:phage tail-like protein
MSFSHVKLTRPINSKSPVLAAWMTAHAYDVQNGTQRGAHTANIQARTVDGTVVCSWKLDRVIPVSWTGPSFDVDSPKVALETLELAHHGFMDA